MTPIRVRVVDVGGVDLCISMWTRTSLVHIARRVAQSWGNRLPMHVRTVYVCVPCSQPGLLWGINKPIVPSWL